MRTPKSDSRYLRFSSYEPNSVSIPSSGTVMRFIELACVLSSARSRSPGYLLVTQRVKRAIIAWLRPQFQVQLVELPGVDRRRRARHQVDGVSGLGERNDLTNRCLAAQNGDD